MIEAKSDIMRRNGCYVETLWSCNWEGFCDTRFSFVLFWFSVRSSIDPSSIQPSLHRHRSVLFFLSFVRWRPKLRTPSELSFQRKELVMRILSIVIRTVWGRKKRKREKHLLRQQWNERTRKGQWRKNSCLYDYWHPKFSYEDSYFSTLIYPESLYFVPPPFCFCRWKAAKRLGLDLDWRKWSLTVAVPDWFCMFILISYSSNSISVIKGGFESKRIVLLCCGYWSQSPSNKEWSFQRRQCTWHDDGLFRPSRRPFGTFAVEKKRKVLMIHHLPQLTI